MAKIANNITELIGKTPLVELTNIALGEDRPALEKKEIAQTVQSSCQSNPCKANIVLKLEAFNPGGSAKDRVALSMIQDAEAKGWLLPGGTIIEPTSGNTGVGLAWIAAVKGYKAIFTMPDTMSSERQNLLKAFGAKVILTPGAEGMQGAINKANSLKEEIEGAVILQQFANPANPQAHLNSTAKEIWEDTDGQVDVFIACVGTGGTISGTGAGLKQQNPKVEVVAVEPDSSAVLSGDKPGKHHIQGIGAGFIPETYHQEVVDKIIRVKDEDAYHTARLLAKKEGILAGISSGAALHAALTLASQEDYAGKMIVVLLPDTGERYLSTKLFSD